MKSHISKRVFEKEDKSTSSEEINIKLKLIFKRIAFFTLSNAVLGFILSSYLSQYMTGEKVSLIFLIPNLISCVVIFFLGDLVRKYSLFKISIICSFPIILSP